LAVIADMNLIPNYFGTNQPLPASALLQAGAVSCLYEHGKVRYIKVGDTEIIRTIYTAVRDKNWATIPYIIIEESIDVQDDMFSISSTFLYTLAGIRYKANLVITGKDNTIIFTFKGVALSKFSYNRIGLCILHPIKECMDKPCVITDAAGNSQTLQFPAQINPHELFKNMVQMQWQPAENCTATLQFEGAPFETEDQRNWADNSYKTYNTLPNRLLPVEVTPGNMVTYTVTLKVDIAGNPVKSTDDNRVTLTGNKFKLPGIGYSKSADKNLNTRQAALLKQVPFDTYRIEIHFDTDWRQLLEQAATEATNLKSGLSMVIFFTDTDPQLQEIVNALKKNYVNIIEDILILDAGRKTTGAETMNKAYPLLKWIFPGIKIGAGTDGYFTEWNRQPLTGIPMDFVSYSLNPQVHANDTRTLIENLQAQQYTISKAGAINPGVPIYVSPITLRSRREPKLRHDERQSSLFNAAWTLLSIKYLAGAASLNYFEATGKDGLMDKETPYPVYDYLKKLKTFNPVYICESQSNSPLSVDALIIENEAGDKLHFIINFSEQPIEIVLDCFEDKLILPATSITVK
jgi:hypothetical protein